MVMVILCASVLNCLSWDPIGILIANDISLDSQTNNKEQFKIIVPNGTEYKLAMRFPSSSCCGFSPFRSPP